ncbi:hypothetical protein PV10_06322 [Exophiala mesophila]|uniref:Plastocyanin-like domain-containing protein n=1 Tax=Exophiala mesophila TaxID=212818 RepID=A0A0D1WRN8_EXOME|nr:uncharacterized protein PV10_06322 [Exophiala mesophila]KIV91825.1 hypothetical protein PV10_06322 [Exophiala mesophila]
MSPGPPLYLREGSTTWVRVFNDLEDQNLTVHGLTQRTAPFSDGTPILSQLPIEHLSFSTRQSYLGDHLFIIDSTASATSRPCLMTIKSLKSFIYLMFLGFRTK